MGAFHIVLAAACVACCSALRVPTPTPPKLPPLVASTPATASAAAAALALLAVVEPAAASDVSWVAPTKFVLQPLLTLGTLAFLMRVVLSWFPKYDLKEFPWVLVAAPTEPILKPTRLLIPPVAGVDISPIVWVSLLSFFSEIFTGPQGLLTIIERKGGL